LLQRANGGSRRRSRGLWIGFLTALIAIGLVAPATSHASRVRVMSRNVFLGADLGPGTSATSIQELVNAAGQILHQVDQNDFRIRAQVLAREILNQNPDLVGLQEAALWRKAPCTDNPLDFTATQLRKGGDFLGLLMKELNKDGLKYRNVIAEPEFDFQVWANLDGNESTSAPGCPFGSETEGRLTMRDVILARTGARVQTSNAQGAHFNTLLQVTPGGVPIDVTRGWTKVNAKVGDAPMFRFVNTHLEAFDNQTTNHTNQNTDVGNGEVRQAQANELIATGGPATGSLPVILLGDLNSDTMTPIKPGDQLADQDLLNAGFVERSTYDPLSCCLQADVLSVGSGGLVSQFDHKVDHVMTDDPSGVTLLRSTVTGRQPYNGWWGSDHAGTASALDVK
jgi:endonuclease/exonuclease/phosphatase family metal-dependent hydrolase